MIGVRFKELYGIYSTKAASDLADRMGKTVNTVWNYCKSEYPTTDMMKQIEVDYPNINWQWFFTGYGPQFVEDDFIPAPQPAKASSNNEDVINKVLEELSNLKSEFINFKSSSEFRFRGIETTLQNEILGKLKGCPRTG